MAVPWTWWRHPQDCRAALDSLSHLMMVGDLRGGSAELEMEWWRARSRGLRDLHTADPGLLQTSLPSLVLLLKARDAGTGRGGAGPGVVVWVL